MGEEKIDFAKLEKKWQDRWEKAKIFEAKEDLKKKKYYVLEMFPYPSGAGLHVGHAFNFVIGDVFARFKLMNGFNVIHPMGFDSLGLPAENAAIKDKKHPKDYTDASIKNFIKQQRTLGLTYDWTRQVNTADSSYYKWDQWIFLKMFEKGLVYQKEAAVNWCPKCDTILANEQVEGGRCWRHGDTEVEIKQMKQWFIKITDYADRLLEGHRNLKWPEKTIAMQKNWIGKSFGTEIDFEINDEKWPIFTTRPDTIFGVTFMVVSSQHKKLWDLVTPKQKKEVEKFLKKLKSVSEKELADMEKEGVFTGSYAINPANGKKVPVYAGNFVVADYGAGMVMAVPAHDQRDFEFAKKYKIPIRQVIAPKKVSYMIIEKSLPREVFSKINSYGEVVIEKTDKDWGEFARVYLDSRKEKELIEFLEKNLLSKSKDGGAWYADSVGTSNIIVFPKKHFIISEENEYKKYFEYGIKLGIPQEQLNHEVRAWTESGKLLNSKEFDGIDNEEAKKKITEWLITKKLARKTVNYKLRDWSVARQRYWGTPIPLIHCSKCGIVPVPEKDLPVELPKEVKFGEGNPLLTNEKWLKVKCPKCNGKAIREANTMDTFVNSSWYFLRYCDPKNDKEIFSKEKAKYWMPVDLYIGGAEHACMHLIYCRFYTMFLHDIGLVDFDEPAPRLFHQGMINDANGEKMSKSKGNVVEPLETMAKYGVDTTRFFVMSEASPDKGFNWSDAAIQGALRIINKIMLIPQAIGFGKDSQEFLFKLNNSIKNITAQIETIDYRKVSIELRELFDLISKQSEISKESFGKALKLLSPFCPHIAEELWEKIGNNKTGKDFISIADWPKYEEIKQKVIKEDLNEKIINNIKPIIEKFPDKKNVYLYVMPFEVDRVDAKKISKAIGKMVDVWPVNDSKKYDPEGRAKKALPGKPGVYFE
jgi:leucyl-tRNA synthetase